MALVQEATYHIVHRHELTDEQQQGVLALCFQAWGSEFTPLWSTFDNSMHVLASVHGHVVSHALWVTRWLQPAGSEPLRTAYVEAVVTDERYRKQGLARAVMQQLQVAITDFDLGALSPSRADFYERLGWEQWRGPLTIRTATGPLATPDEEVMILRLPRTPALDLDAPLSAEWRVGELW